MQYSDLEKISNLYIGSKFENILWNVNDVMIPFDPAWANIGVSVSGGADSALLAYMLCSIITQENLTTDVHVTTNIRCWKTRPWQETNSIDVYNYLQTKFPNINFHRHVNFIPPEMEEPHTTYITDEYGEQKPGNRIILRAHAEYIGHKYKLNAWYNAVTKNPSNVSLTNRVEDRDIEADNLDIMIKEYQGSHSIHPFRYIEKDWIVAQYHNLKILPFFEITRSCEGEFDHLNFKNYQPKMTVPECGECFWCQERNWAINNKTPFLKASKTQYKRHTAVESK
jgi:hypothetical protein